MEQQKFTEGQRVIFRESEDGPPEHGTAVFEHEPDERYPNGGEYLINMDDGGKTIAFWTELTPED